MDLYDEARALALRLRGAVPASAYRDMQLTDTALWWRVSHGQLSRLHRGVYLGSMRPPDLLDLVKAALLVLPERAMVGFHTAAQLMGFGVLDTSAIHIVVPAGTPFPQRPGIVAHQVTVPIGEPEYIHDVPCVPPERCAVDLARTARRPNAITVLDAALRSGTCSGTSLGFEVARHRGLRGVRQARELIPLADGRAECRQESQLRLVLHDGGIRGLEPQVEVSDDRGVPRFRLDLGDRKRRVGAEYDGASHLDRARHRADRNRHNWLAARGWAMRYFTDRDLYYRPRYIVHAVHAAQNR